MLYHYFDLVAVLEYIFEAATLKAVLKLMVRSILIYALFLFGAAILFLDR